MSIKFKFLAMFAIIGLNSCIPPKETKPKPNNSSKNSEPLSLENLPLGDGKYATTPKIGYVFTCKTDFRPGNIGAQTVGNWINQVNKTYNFLKKVVVQGTKSWTSSFNTKIESDQRILVTNGLPNHASGEYPIAKNDPAYTIDRNPNAIATQSITFSLPKDPSLKSTPDCLPNGPIGVFLTGVPLFHAVDEQGYDAPAHEVQDSCQGHPEVSGTYHYHSISSCADKSGVKATHSPLLGYALDGFGIYGKYGEKGIELHNSDLDECHGHSHEINWDGKQLAMYHYHGTSEYPYTIGCFRGNKGSLAGYNPSMPEAGGKNSAPEKGAGGTTTQTNPNLSLAAAKLGITVEKLEAALGPPPPNLAAAAQQLGIPQQTLKNALGVP